MRVRNEVMRAVALYNQRYAEGDYSDSDGPECVPVVVFECISRDDFER